MVQSTLWFPRAESWDAAGILQSHPRHWAEQPSSSHRWSKPGEHPVPCRTVSKEGWGQPSAIGLEMADTACHFFSFWKTRSQAALWYWDAEFPADCWCHWKRGISQCRKRDRRLWKWFALFSKQSYSWVGRNRWGMGEDGESVRISRMYFWT